MAAKVTALPPKVKNISGKRFGRFTVLRFIDTQNQGSRWLVKCDCGTEKILPSKTFVGKGHIKSCGCLKVDRDRNFMTDEESAERRAFTVYKVSAKSRGLSFSLTQDEFIHLAKSECEYCGAGPQNKTVPTRKNGSRFVYNGIDRINNSLGYESGNVVSCCKRCNRMKMDMTVEQFLEKCMAIVRGISLKVPQTAEV